MRKSHYRDYATEAFRFLAREGSAAAYCDRIWNDALERQRRREAGRFDGISAPTEAAVARAEQALYDAHASIADLEAAEWSLQTLEKMRGRHAVTAVKTVYMLTPDHPLERGEIQARVAAASIGIPADPATIYRWLALARDMFAEHRGLRIS